MERVQVQGGSCAAIWHEAVRKRGDNYATDMFRDESLTHYLGKQTLILQTEIFKYVLDVSIYWNDQATLKSIEGEQSIFKIFIGMPKVIQELVECRIIFLWAFGHGGISGNEEMNQLEKKDANNNRKEVPQIGTPPKLSKENHT